MADEVELAVWALPVRISVLERKESFGERSAKNRIL